MYDGFIEERIDVRHVFWHGRLPDSLIPVEAGFEALWNLHPDEYHEIKIHGRLVRTPRWQQPHSILLILQQSPPRQAEGIGDNGRWAIVY